MTQHSFQKPAKEQTFSHPTRVVLSGVRGAVIGPNLIFEAYRTAVATIVIGLDADIALHLIEDSDTEGSHHSVVVIPPGTLCELSADGDIAVLFCDPLSDDFSEIDLRGIDGKIDELRDLLKQGPLDRHPKQFLGEIFAELGVTSARVTRLEIALVASALGREPEKFSNVETAAALAGLSPMRFQHVFTEALGIPFRRYRQWRRMGRVIRALAGGESLTEAAYGSGFSNSAHLSTAFKAMFGLRPSDLLATNAEYFLADTDEVMS